MTHGVEAYYRHGHGENPLILRTADDMDALINALLTETWENQMATVYHLDRPLGARGLPDHEFHVAVDPDTRTGALRCTGPWDGGGTWFSKGDTGRTGGRAVLPHGQ